MKIGNVGAGLGVAMGGTLAPMLVGWNHGSIFNQLFAINGPKEKTSRARARGRRDFTPRAKSASVSPPPPRTSGQLQRVRIVVVGAQHGGNVGAICRVAANFECPNIWLVNPSCDHFVEDAWNAAANDVSRALLHELHVVPALSHALQDCSMAIAFTKRTGLLRLPTLTVSEIESPKDDELDLALVFGREDCGLHTDEILQCTHICTISSGSWEGSLNLSHAVSVALSRVFEKLGKNESCQRPAFPVHSTAYKSLPGTATIGEVENLLRRWEHVLAKSSEAGKMLGQAEYKNPHKMIIFVRKLLQRASPSIREIAYFHGFLTIFENLSTSTLQSHISKQENSDCKRGDNGN